MFKQRYADKFGFIEEEVCAMLSIHPIAASFENITQWYNSYSAGRDVSLYNPWSIISICDSNSLESYWVETGIFFIFKF